MQLTQVLYCPSCERELPTAPVHAGPQPTCPNDGTPLYVFPRGIRPGDVIDGRYAVERPIGQGGMGIVFAARQIAIDREVALKFVHGGTTADPGELKRFLREARMSASIAHPNVVTVHDYGQTHNGQIYIAMELIRGHLLSQLIESEAPFTPRRAASLIAQCAEALSAAHARGVIHRDLKPANVFIVPGEDGVELVKVVDFGLAKPIGSADATRSLTATGNVLGTPAYMSPEQIQKGPITPASDFYALGCLLYAMLTGSPPFRGSMLDVILGQLGKEPQPPSSHPSQRDTPKALDRLCLDLLSKDPARRPATAADVLGRLEPWLSKVPRPVATIAQPISEPVRPARPTLKPPFVGRAELCARFEGLMQEALLSQRASLIVLEAPGGYGKSRLVGWLESAFMRDGWRVVRGLHQEGAGGALGALREALQALERPARAAHLTVPLTPPPGTLNTRAVAAEPSLHEMSPAQLTRKLADHMAQEPTLVVLEDLRGPRPFDQEALEQLAFTVAECERPGLVLLAVRTDADPAGLSNEDAARLTPILRERLHRIRLSPLTPSEMDQLVEAALPGADIELVSHVRSHANGNPLHALQLLRHLTNEAALLYQDGHWRLVRRPPMPADVHELLRERIARLPLSGPEGEAQQALLIRAALLGPRLSVRWLEALLQREGRYDLIDGLDRRLDRLITDGWLRDLEVWDDDVIQFDHGYLHEALAAMMDGRRAARALHRHAAEALELAFAGDLDAHARAIGEHWAAGGEPARALPWMVWAARAAEARYVPRDALAAWLRAEALLEAAEAGADVVTAVRLGIARQQFALGHHDEAEATVSLLPEDAPERLELLGELADARARDAEALDHFAQAARAWRAAGADARAASVDLRHGRILYKIGRIPEAEALFRATLALAEQTGDRRLEADACNALTQVSDRLDRRDEAAAFISREERLRRELGDPVALGRCLYVKMGRHTRRHETALASRDMAEALELLSRSGHRRGLASTLRLAGVVALGEGRLEEALAITRRARTLLRRLGDRRGEQRALAELADVFVAMRKYDEALEHARASLSLSEELGGQDRFVGYLTLGQSLLASDRAAEAIEPLQRALEEGERHHCSPSALDETRRHLQEALQRTQTEPAEV